MMMYYRPLSDDEIKAHTPVVITCTENRREVCAVQNIANKQIDRSFVFDKVCYLYIYRFTFTRKLCVVDTALSIYCSEA